MEDNSTQEENQDNADKYKQFKVIFNVNVG